ncbi:MAG TPA: metal ABC transporter permease, partial [Thermodesulfobacteriota bacterium]|nr:metal ABC transporter permease [Thermodesulfobacteriota bacterium]
MDLLGFLWPALAAGLVLAGIHAYLGLHVLVRGVIFVDLALAQVAALGAAVAALAGHPPQSATAYSYSLAFALAGAGLLAFTRTAPSRVPQEALIGVVYVVAAAAAVLVLDRAPEGAERVKALLVGNIVAVTPAEVRQLALLYGAVGLVHWLFRRRFLDLSWGRLPASAAARAWDFAFYASFAVVVTSSVRVAGVLLVFSYLVIPAAVGALLADGVGRRLAIGWAVGAATTAAGLAASVAWDLPTGA